MLCAKQPKIRIMCHNIWAQWNRFFYRLYGFRLRFFCTKHFHERMFAQKRCIWYEKEKYENSVSFLWNNVKQSVMWFLKFRELFESNKEVFGFPDIWKIQHLCKVWYILCEMACFAFTRLHNHKRECVKKCITCCKTPWNLLISLCRTIQGRERETNCPLMEAKSQSTWDDDDIETVPM